MKVQMNSLVLKLSRKEIKDSLRHSIVRIGIGSELEAVEICVRQIIQLSTTFFDEISFDLVPKLFEFQCNELHIISNTTLL